MSVEQLNAIDFQQLATACESLGQTVGIKIRTTAVKKLKIVHDFVDALLNQTKPEDENNLQDIVFVMSDAILAALGVDNLTKALNSLKASLLEVPVTKEEPAPPEQVEPVPVPPPAPPAPPATVEPPKRRGRKPKPKVEPSAETPAPPQPKSPKPPKEPRAQRRSEGRTVIGLTKFVWEHINLDYKQVFEELTKAKIDFSEATLLFEYKAVHRSKSILLELGIIK